ncbi:MAG: heme-binding protein [Treponema sp.]|jgi:uncharacterized protein (UPF0303 family)|nr:heme-binding protein [Treponema sp.]
MNDSDYIKIVEAQEEALLFPRFSRQDAWKLGALFVKEILVKEHPVAVSVRLTSGLTLFQYAAEGAALNNEAWIAKKFRTLAEFDESGLLTFFRLRQRGRSLEDRGLNPRKYAATGGSFPIRVKGAGLIGAALVSGLDHVLDHELLVECVAHHLKAEPPRLPKNTE